MNGFISKIRQVRDYGSNEDTFRVFDHTGTYIELTPTEMYDVITAGWEALGRPSWKRGA